MVRHIRILDLDSIVVDAEGGWSRLPRRSRVVIQVEVRAAERVRQRFMMLETDTQSVTAGIQFIGNKALSLIDSHRALPAFRQSKLGIVEVMIFHRASQHAAVEGLIVSHQRTALQPRLYLGIERLKSRRRNRIIRTNAVHRDIHPEIGIPGRLDQRRERIANDPVFHPDNPDRTRTTALARSRLKINRRKIHSA